MRSGIPTVPQKYSGRWTGPHRHVRQGGRIGRVRRNQASMWLVTSYGKSTVSFQSILCPFTACSGAAELHTPVPPTATSGLGKAGRTRRTPHHCGWLARRQDAGPPRSNFIRKLAEREGFEPSVGISYARFPGVCLKPLSHLSACALINVGEPSPLRNGFFPRKLVLVYPGGFSSLGRF